MFLRIKSHKRLATDSYHSKRQLSRSHYAYRQANNWRNLRKVLKTSFNKRSKTMVKCLILSRVWVCLEIWMCKYVVKALSKSHTPHPQLTLKRTNRDYSNPLTTRAKFSTDLNLCHNRSTSSLEQNRWVAACKSGSHQSITKWTSCWKMRSLATNSQSNRLRLQRASRAHSQSDNCRHNHWTKSITTNKHKRVFRVGRSSNLPRNLKKELVVWIRLLRR